MEQSPSGTFSDEYVREIEDSLNWHAAILAVLLQEAGGVVEIREHDLLGIRLDKARATVGYDPERKVYVIEGLHTEDDN